jgi:hypothetical protein
MAFRPIRGVEAMKLRLRDLDVFYISYDEPDCDFTHRELVERTGKQVKRVHGVKGFHAAHRRCAELSETKRFVTIDGDNIVMDDLFDQVIDISQGADLVFSFRAQNIINGLEYGNGGVKVWPRGLVLQVPTHEQGSNPNENDFCWRYRYMQVDHLGSQVHCNYSPYQAFRAGYREAIKLSLIEGKKLATWKATEAVINKWNLSRLKTWLSTGAEIQNGLWAILGARRGFYDLWNNQVQLQDINDYDYMNMYFHATGYKDEDVENNIIDMFDPLYTIGMYTRLLSPKLSVWFKDVYVNAPRSGIMNPVVPPVEFDDV